MLTVAEVALHVKGGEDYVRKLIRSGVLPAIRPTPRKTLVAEADVIAFLSPPGPG